MHVVNCVSGISYITLLPLQQKVPKSEKLIILRISVTLCQFRYGGHLYKKAIIKFFKISNNLHSIHQFE